MAGRDRFWIIEDDIGEAPADDDAGRDPCNQGIGLLSGHWRGVLRQQADQIEPAQKNARDISEAVPAQREWTDLKQHGIKMQRRKIDRGLGMTRETHRIVPSKGKSLIRIF